MKNERDEPACFVMFDTVSASGLQPDDTIIPKDAKRFLDEDDGVLGGNMCPPCYRVTAVRATDSKVIAEAVLAWFSAWGDRRKTFHIDRAKEVTVLPAKAYRSLRAEWAKGTN
jgi:hypothetical protein